MKKVSQFMYKLTKESTNQDKLVRVYSVVFLLYILFFFKLENGDVILLKYATEHVILLLDCF